MSKQPRQKGDKKLTRYDIGSPDSPYKLEVEVTSARPQSKYWLYRPIQQPKSISHKNQHQNDQIHSYGYEEFPKLSSQLLKGQNRYNLRDSKLYKLPNWVNYEPYYEFSRTSTNWFSPKSNERNQLANHRPTSEIDYFEKYIPKNKVNLSSDEIVGRKLSQYNIEKRLQSNKYFKQKFSLQQIEKVIPKVEKSRAFEKQIKLTPIKLNKSIDSRNSLDNNNVKHSLIRDNEIRECKLIPVSNIDLSGCDKISHRPSTDWNKATIESTTPIKSQIRPRDKIKSMEGLRKNLLKFMNNDSKISKNDYLDVTNSTLKLKSTIEGKQSDMGKLLSLIKIAKPKVKVQKGRRTQHVADITL